MNENKNQPAFAYYSEDEKRDMPGLTKREYFAGLAMQGLLANSFDYTAQDIVEKAVQYADKILVELEK
jgi:hypothetical protein